MRYLLCVVLLVLTVSCQTTGAKYDAQCSECTYRNAYDKAAEYGETTGRGVILHLHGCDGLYVSSSWQAGWLHFLTQKGFLVVAPDSFQDVRPAEMCPGAAFRTDELKYAVYAVRIKQTHYAIDKIRERYPNKKLYLWGHSEGAVLIRKIDRKVDGAFSTGASCADDWIQLSEDIPYLGSEPNLTY